MNNIKKAYRGNRKVDLVSGNEGAQTIDFNL